MYLLIAVEECIYEIMELGHAGARGTSSLLHKHQCVYRLV